jgi:hypothetical protein
MLVSKEELFRRADIVSIHLVLSRRTRGLVGAAELALMKPTARLVNTSRGPIVVEADLLEALRNNKIAGAAIDVFDQEPLPHDHPFRSQPNLLATPHIGYVSRGLYQHFYRTQSTTSPNGSTTKRMPRANLSPGSSIMVERRDVEFAVEGGDRLRAWLFLPSERVGKLPAISLAHGYAGVKEHGLERFAQAFAEAGFIALVHDHRNFGASDGAVRHDIDPWRQIADWRRAISFLESQPEVDATRIGVWGTSYAGGHVLVLGATDRRIRAVVSQVPTISGYEQGLRRVPPDAVATLEHQFDEDERAQHRGEPPRLQQVVSADPSIPASYRTPDAIAFYLQPLPPGVWKNEVTVRSGRVARTYEPGHWATRVSPTPLLMIVALSDNITLTDLQLRVFEQMLEPKKLATVEGGHFDPYLKQFPRASEAAVSWFRQHLTADAHGER